MNSDLYFYLVSEEPTVPTYENKWYEEYDYEYGKKTIKQTNTL